MEGHALSWPQSDDAATADPKTDATERVPPWEEPVEGHGPSWPRIMEGHALSWPQKGRLPVLKE